MKEADLIKYKNIPDELKREKRWCLYKIIVRDGKKHKDADYAKRKTCQVK